MRCIGVFTIAALLISCTTQSSHTSTSTSSSRLPALSGRTDLLKTSDVFAIVAAVKHKFGPSTRVYRVNVERPNQAQAFYGNPDTYDLTGGNHAAELERRGSDWRLTGYQIVTVVTD